MLALRPAGGWSAIERRQVRALAERMAELRAINRTIEAEGLMVPGRGGRLAAHPLISVRKATELAIKRARTDLGLNISVGESRRQGRAQAAAGDEFGIMSDGSISAVLAFAMDPDCLLARPDGHTFEGEELLHARLCEAGELDTDGDPIEGGRVYAAANRAAPMRQSPATGTR
ncbi:P27 family phage terminase small subunit [Reyranella aquatilis]|uniref:P27 family phage terminase small subunit n=1 Tax=Reyranella aquatilis TaxID=2035356 RepID=A0ABS8L2P2_9HYPH|nr:P27 family phage terminase small subunit [Reyranella aquatilis]MCC8432108.1 P27 family phage terminase small subunit [Reyranella aquatilis]